MEFDFKNASTSERKAECKRIAAEVGDDLFFTKKELDHLPEILLDGERVISFTSGMMDGNTWLITLTDKRIIFLDKGMLYGLKQAVIDLDKVNAVSGETGLILGSISIQDGATSRTIKNVQKKTVVNFTNKVRDALEARKHPQSFHSTPTHSAESSDIISQLERLASLREKGILSQDEFEQQKSKLIQSESHSTKQIPALEHTDTPIESVGSENPPQTPRASQEAIHSRKVSTRLIAGIVVFPLLFSWFTLGKGYSQRTRLFSFAWLLVTLIFALSGGAEKQPATTAEATPVEQTESAERSWDNTPATADVAAEKPEVAVESKPAATFDLTPTLFTQKFNKIARTIDPSFSIGKLVIKDGQVNDTFTHMFSNNIGLVGVIDKSSGKVTSFMYLFSGSQDSNEIVQAIVTPLIVSQIVNPEQKKEAMSKLIMGMITDSMQHLDSGETVEHEVGDVKYSSGASKLTGLMLSIEPKAS